VVTIVHARSSVTGAVRGTGWPVTAPGAVVLGADDARRFLIFRWHRFPRWHTSSSLVMNSQISLFIYPM
jgi:hypothetical protein